MTKRKTLTEKEILIIVIPIAHLIPAAIDPVDLDLVPLDPDHLDLGGRMIKRPGHLVEEVDLR